MGSKDSWAHLLSALAQPRPWDLEFGDLGDSATPVSPQFILLPQKWIFFSKSQRMGNCFCKYIFLKVMLAFFFPEAMGAN